MNSLTHMRMPSRQRGVTLLELMIVVVVIATLAAIAIPSYRGYQQRAQRTEAKSALLRLQANQERFYLQNNRYSNDPEEIGFSSDLSENGLYTLSIATDNGWTQDFTATAVPTPGGGTNNVNMSGDTHCASFSLDSSGERDATNDDCW